MHPFFGKKIKPFWPSNLVYTAGMPVFLLVAIITLAQSGTACGQTLTHDWTNVFGSTDPFFETRANWNTNLRPDANDYVRFLSSNTYEVWWDNGTVAKAPEVGALLINDGNVGFVNKDTSQQSKLIVNGSASTVSGPRFLITGPDTTLTLAGMHLQSTTSAKINNQSELIVSGPDSELSTNSFFDIDSRLTVQNQGRVTGGTAQIGVNSSELATATVTGTGSELFFDQLVVYQNGGQNALHVSDNAVVANSETTNQGLITVSDAQFDAGSLLATGTSDLSLIQLENGATLTSTNAHIGNQAGEFGTVEINGGSNWQSEFIQIGSGGNGVLRINSGTASSDGTIRIGANLIDGVQGDGLVQVTGAGSLLKANNSVQVGGYGNGTMEVTSGGDVQSKSGAVAIWSGSNSSALVSGLGSSWIIDSQGESGHGGLVVGNEGNGSMLVNDGGFVLSESGMIGSYSDSNSDVVVSGAGSLWQNVSDLDIAGTSTVNSTSNTGRLDILNGGKVVAGGTTRISSGGTLQINQGELSTGSLDNSRNGQLQLYGGTLRVNGNGGTFDPGSTSFTINGVHKSANPMLSLENGTSANLADGLVVGDNNNGALQLLNGGSMNSGDSSIATQSGSSGLVLIDGADSNWSAENLFVGGTLNASGGSADVTVTNEGAINTAGTTKLWSNGSLTIQGGSVTTESFNNIAGGTLNLNDGILTVDGGTFEPGSNEFQINGNAVTDSPVLELTNSATAIIGTDTLDYLTIGDTASGTLRMSNGARLITQSTRIGSTSTGFGSVTVEGNSTQWLSETQMIVGDQGSGLLNVKDGAVVSSEKIFIGYNSSAGRAGFVVVDDAELQINDYIRVGGVLGRGNLTVENGGMVTSGLSMIGSSSHSSTDDRTSIGLATVTDSGSYWLISDDLRIGGAGSGELRIEKGGRVTNLSGQIGYAETEPHGAGFVTVTGANSVWTNQSGLFIGGTDVEAKGTGSLTISDGGSVSAKADSRIWETGQLLVSDGTVNLNGQLSNQGTIEFAGTEASFYGDIENMDTGSILTTGSSTANIYGDVVHNGQRIDTKLNGKTRFHGIVTGAGHYSGEGTVRFENEFHPGNSPAVIRFGGDVEFGADSTWFVELGGLETGQFDQLRISGDLSLNGGTLDVAMWDGFELEEDQEFLIGSVNGSMIGEFHELQEGSRVATFGDVGLHVTYRAGSGNDIGLYTLSAVPEPSSMLMVVVVLGLLSSRRRRKMLD